MDGAGLGWAGLGVAQFKTRCSKVFEGRCVALRIHPYPLQQKFSGEQ